MPPANPTKPISEPHRGRAGTIAQVLFFSIFFVVGMLAAYFLFFRPAMNVWRAGNWPAVPCTVLESRVKTHSGDESDTYSVYIKYRYTYAGREYLNDRYSFGVGSSSGRSGKQRIVDAHPPGRQTQCYVNPDRPDEAVLNRGFVVHIYFGLFPLIFALVGAGGIVYMVRKRMNPPPEPPAAAYLPSPAIVAPALRGTPSVARGGPVTLKPRESPRAKFIGLLIFTLIWCGIISLPVLTAIAPSGRSGKLDVCFALFMVPFVLAGLAMIVGTLYTGLSLLNPRVRVGVSSRSVVLGGAADLVWQFDGRHDRITRLRIWLEGREEATYTRGTTTTTDKETFARIDLVDTAQAVDIHSGKCRLVIPADAMHSFSAANNKIVWAITLRGEIPSWPDVKESYELVVMPHHPPQGAAA